jgi:hypothetical protein
VALLDPHSCETERPQPDHILCPREPTDGAIGGVYQSAGSTIARRTKRFSVMFFFGERRAHSGSTLSGFPE